MAEEATPETARPTVYDYRDYRQFLTDLFAYHKEANDAFSHRYFSRRAGFKSPNFLKLVMTGQRNLTNESVAKVAKGFGLEGQEREFFENLVWMNQATDHEERDHYYRRLLSIGGFLKLHPIEKERYDYFSKWYYPAIRELAVFGEARHTAKELAKMLTPSITTRQASQALKSLVTLGLLRQTEDGRWEQCDAAVSTGPEVDSITVENFHREMLRLAGESIGERAPDQRDVTGVTMAIRREDMAELKRKAAAFRRELIALACRTKRPNEVVQVCIQMFPIGENGNGKRTGETKGASR